MKSKTPSYKLFFHCLNNYYDIKMSKSRFKVHKELNKQIYLPGAHEKKGIPWFNSRWITNIALIFLL